MATVSAILATRNEEDHIDDCLRTLEWCDEIVVVDSHSDDRTVEIASRYTDEIHQQPPMGYGDPARKRAFEEASGEWIVMVDADERLTRSLAEQLRTQAEAGTHDVVSAPRKNFICGDWVDGAGWWPDYRPVLYRRSVAELSGEIHDFVSFDEGARELRLPVAEENAVVHFLYTDIADFISRTNRYTDVEAERIDFSYGKLLRRPLEEFGYRFVSESGYREGMLGFTLSALMAFYRFIALAKAWQLSRVGTREQIASEYDQISEANRWGTEKG